MAYTIEYIASEVPKDADYVIYPVGRWDITIVQRERDGSWERVGRIPVYMADYIVDGAGHDGYSVWCLKEMRFLAGSPEQKAFQYVAPVKEEPVRKDPQNVEKADRNWQIWRERKLTNKTLRQIGEEHGIGPERVRGIIAKGDRMIRSRFFYNYHTDKITPQMMAAVKDMEFVYPADYGYYILMPDGRKDYLR